MFRSPVAVVMVLTLAAGAARADELCDFVKDVAASSPGDIKGEILEENTTAADFTIYATALHAPLEGFRPCVLEQRTKNDGELSQLLVCHHAEADEALPLPDERFEAIGARLDGCTGKKGVGFGGRLMWTRVVAGLKRIDLVSKKRGARLLFVFAQ